jgi:streptogramin lyase
MNRITLTSSLLALGAVTLIGCGGTSGGSVAQAFPSAIYFAKSSALDVASMTDMSGGNWRNFGNLGQLTSLAFDQQGRMLAAEWNNNRIVRFSDPDTMAAETFGELGSGTNQLSNPTDVALDKQGRIYIADSANRRIVRMNDFTGAGWTTLDLTSLLPHDNPTLDVAVDGSGRIYVLSRWERQISQFDDMEDTTPTLYGIGGSDPGEFYLPSDIQIGPDGKIYIADTTNNRIARIDDMTGSGWISFGSVGSGVGNFENPKAISFDGQGRIYVIDSGNYRVVRIDDMTGDGWTSYGVNNTPEGGSGASCDGIVVKS